MGVEVGESMDGGRERRNSVRGANVYIYGMFRFRDEHSLYRAGEEIGSNRQPSMENIELKVIRCSQPAPRAKPTAPSPTPGRCCEGCQPAPMEQDTTAYDVSLVGSR